MNATHTSTRYDFPFDLHWTSQDLADAVPLRLSELVDFNAVCEIGNAPASANAAAPPPAKMRCGYLPTEGFRPGFRVR